MRVRALVLGLAVALVFGPASLRAEPLRLLPAGTELRWSVGTATSGEALVGLPPSQAETLLAALEQRLPAIRRYAHAKAEEAAQERARAEAAEARARAESDRADAQEKRGDAWKDAVEDAGPSGLERFFSHPVTWAVAIVGLFAGGFALGAHLGGE